MTQTLSWQGLTFKPQALEIVVSTEDMSPIYPWEFYETAYKAFRKPELLLLDMPVERIDVGAVVYYLCEWLVTDIDNRISDGMFEGKLHRLIK